MLRRRRARRSLIDFANAIEVPGKPATNDPDEWLFQPVETTMAAHHRLLLTHLEQIARGEIQRLMVFMPPGSAKSSYTSVVFPTWFMGWKPGARVILASYASDIARKQGRRARQIVRSDLYVPIFNARISDDTSAADQWALDNESEFMAGGLLSGITGNRAHGIIIDDPVAGREEADSETVQKKTYEAYQDDLRTRLVPGGWEILCQTRWNQKDLAGRILPLAWNGESGPIECRDGKVWHVICLPAIADRDDDPLGRKIGERLWPEWFTDEHFATFRKQSRTWNALFQQRPTSPEGDYFKREWFRVISADRVPRLVKVTRAWDLAATTEAESDDPDRLAGVKMGLGEDNKYYVLHCHADRLTPEGVEKTIKLFGGTDGRDVAVRIEQEGAASGKIVKYHFERMMDGWNCRFTGIPRTSKLTRAGPFNAACERGDVMLVEGKWNEEYVEELCQFPTGAHDDRCFIAGTMIETATGEQPIEDIRPGDFVLTRAGFRRVVAAGMTNAAAPVISLTLPNGRTLTGTAKHPVFTEENGFIPLDTVAGSHTLLQCESIRRHQRQTPSFSMASRSTDTQIASGRTCGITTLRTLGIGEMESARCTRRFGSQFTGRSLRSTKCTTLTVTRSTMRSATWNATPSQNIAASMLSEVPTEARCLLPIWTEYDPRRSRGISPKRGGLGIVNTRKQRSESESCFNWSARRAANSLSLSTGMPVSAQTFAIRDRASGKPNLRNVSFAAWSSSGPSTSQNNDSALARAPASRNTLAAVYNLTVDGVPEYFANGVLVHNCDASVGSYTDLSSGIGADLLNKLFGGSGVSTG